MTKATISAGAGFLIGDVDPATMSTPEQLSDEQRMLRETTRKFVQSEIEPRIEELEELNPDLLKEIMVKTAELGLCMIDIPEEYGGLGLDFVSSMQPPEIMSRAGGFSTAFEGQTVIGVLPIVYFGSEELKRKYLPKIATAEAITAYALTEAGSGSDALAAKTTAVASADGGSWILNGTKQFITNGGIADLFIVFAQVDDHQFSAFVVDRDSPGFSVGPEEHKMGIKSSSTTALAFADCKIPKENLIGEVGWGARIALNVLNVGRLKIAAQGIGAAKEALEESVKYALERRQFGKAIAEFGIIREKIAEMASRIYAGESTMMRTAGMVMEAIESSEHGGRGPQAMMAALREYNVECALDKVHGSEIQAYCADEAVQIHGGYGFIEEYKVARIYRDARITRLYEGTNEINRMQVAGDILKRAEQGKLVLEPREVETAEGAGPMEAVAGQVARHKSIVARLVKLISEGHAGKVDKRGANQEILQRLADIVIAVYGAESAMGRALRARADGSENADLFETMTRVYAARAAGIVARSVGEAAGLMEASGAEIGGEIEKIRSLAVAEPCDAIGLRRQVAEAIIGREGIWFN